MQAKELISNIFPSISIDEIGERALVRMDFFKISHIPLTDKKGNYYGLISENEIYDFDLLNKAFRTYKKVLARPYVYEDQHIYLALNLFSKLNISVVPVLNNKEKYVGSICHYDVIKHMGKITDAENSGTIFILDISIHDYSLSQISQIIEGNNAKVLSLYTSTKKDSTKLEVTIKINTNDFSAIRQTFERYNYTIKASYSESDKFNELIEERYEELMNYLNI